jgi:hypothetical protein
MQPMGSHMPWSEGPLFFFFLVGGGGWGGGFKFYFYFFFQVVFSVESGLFTFHLDSWQWTFHAKLFFFFLNTNFTWALHFQECSLFTLTVNFPCMQLFFFFLEYGLPWSLHFVWGMVVKSPGMVLVPWEFHLMGIVRKNPYYFSK